MAQEECNNQQQQMCMKNTVMKSQHKVSQRGPGVAELEKMLMTKHPNHETDDNISISPPVYPLLLPKPPRLMPKHGFTNTNWLNYSHSMMNQYTASSIPSPAFNQLELPSNPISQLCYTSLWHEDEKTVGMKRSCPFSGYPWSPSMLYKVPPFPPTLNMSEQQSTSSNHLVSNYEPRNKISRDAKRRCQTEGKSNECSDGNDTFDGNILTLGPAMTPSPSSSLTLKEDSSEAQNFSLHKRMKDDRFQSSRQGGKNKIEKPFYNFLLPNGHMDIAESTLSLRDEKDGTRHTLDLDLKL